MKKIILLFCLAICASTAFGQLKVITNGNSIAGSNSGLTADQSDAANTLLVNGRTYMTTGSVVNTGASASLMFDRQDESAFIIGAGNEAGMSWDQNYNYELRSNIRSRITQNRFIQNGALRMKILGSNGNVGIGNISTPAQKLHVAGSIQYTGSLINASDNKLKSDINDFNYGLNEVMQLNPVTYHYNDKAQIDNNDLNTGLLAQELQKVAPELVKQFTIHTMDDDNVEVVSEDNYLGIQESSIKYMLINAIQQQQEMIEDQADKIDELQEAINTIGATEINNTTSVTLTSYDLAELGQNTPNPFNGFTNISYVVPSNASSAKIAIFGTSGQMLKSLDIDHTGEGTLVVNAQDLPTGTYSYQLFVDGKSIDSNKMVLTR